MNKITRGRAGFLRECFPLRVLNGQWSMPVRHKASPFWAQAVKRNMYISFRTQFQVSLTAGKKCRNFPNVHSSDDGIISLFLTMVPNLCIDKKLGFDSPQVRGLLPKDRYRTDGFQARILRAQQWSGKFAMRDANFQCCLHTQYDQGCSPAVCAKVQTRSFQRCKFSCHSRDQSVSDGGVTIDRQSFRKRTSSV